MPQLPPSRSETSRPSGSDGLGRDEELSQLKEDLAAATAAACKAYEDNARMVRVLSVLGQPYDPQEMSAQALTALCQTFDADVTCLARPAGDRLVITSACGLPEEDPAFSKGWPSSPASAEALATLTPVTRDESTAEENDVPTALADLGVRSMAWIPLEDTGELLIVFRRAHPWFTQAELQVLESVAFRIGIALRASERRARAERLALCGYRLARHLEMASLFEEAAGLLGELVGGEVIGVITIDRGLATLNASQGTGQTAHWPTPAATLPWWDSVATGRTYRRGAAEPFDTGLGPARAALCVPLLKDGVPAVVLCALRRTSRAFRDDDVEVATTLAYYLRAAMTNAQLYRALRERESALRLITDSVSDLIAVVDSTGRLQYASPSHHRELSHRPDSLFGTDIFPLIHPDEVDRLRTALGDPDQFPTIEYRVATGTGSWVWVESALRPALTASGRSVVLSSRVIEERRRLEDELRRQATRDPLTGLANRVLVGQRLELVLSGTDGVDWVGLLFCDLDRFKAVNDRLGHEFGDELLRQVALRLTRCAGPGDLLARVGGDEFVFVLPDVSGLDLLTEVGHTVIEALREPFALRGEVVPISVSVGGVCGRAGHTTAGAMMRNADAAMYAAKRRGLGLVEVFDEAASHRSLDHLQIRSDLQLALDRHQLVVHYQPILDMRSGEIVTFEALLRWNHPERGLIPPDVFIPLAEETGLIVSIGSWVLDQAVRQLAQWQRRMPRGDGRPRLGVNVNLSSAQLHRGELARELVDVVRRSGVAPEDVWLEVTEHGAIGGEATEPVAILHEAGIRLCLDDFGMLHSNLDYLARLPVDCLKIDRSFVTGMTGETERRGVNQGIVRAVLAIADSLDVTVVAEGIESVEQRHTLLELGCGLGQGFLFSKPLPAPEATALLRRGGAA